MKKLLLILAIAMSIAAAGCRKVHCYQCNTAAGTLPRTYCSDDNDTAKHYAYNELAQGGTLTDDNGVPLICHGYDK